MSSEIEYAILYKKNMVNDNKFLFIPILVLKGISVDDKFIDESGSIFSEFTNIAYQEENDDYYFGYKIPSSTLENTYNSSESEILKINYFNDSKEKIIFAKFDEQQGDLIIKILDTNDIFKNSTSDDIEKDTDVSEIETISFAMEYIMDILKLDADNLKESLMYIMDIYNIDINKNNNEYVSELNPTNIYKTIINKFIVNDKDIIADVENSSITSKDISLIEELVKVEKSIYDLYDNLCNLEYNNKKDTEEYSKYLDFLNIALDVERNIYNELNLDFNKSLLILNYIIENLLKQNYEKLDKCMSTSGLYILRMFNSFKKYIVDQYDTLEGTINEDFSMALITLLNEKYYYYKMSKLIEYFEINKFIENAILKNLLNETSKFKNKYSTKIKYITSYLNVNCECDLVRDKFNVNPNINNEYNYQYDKDLMKNIKNGVSGNTIIRETFNLLHIDDKQYELEENKLLVELIKNKIIACLNTIDSSELEKIKPRIYKFLTTTMNNQSGVLMNQSNNSREIINQIFTDNKILKKKMHNTN